MKKFILSAKLIFALTVVILGFSSCQKTSSSGGSLSNGFKIDGTTYQAKASMRGMLGANSIQFFDVTLASLGSASSYNTCAIAFNNTQGIAAGTYKVIGTDDVNTLASGEISIFMVTGANSTGAGRNFLKDITSSTTVNATVTITGGKISVVMNSSPFMSAMSGSSTLTYGHTAEVNLTEL